jgi:hypothetical protein
MRIKLTTFWDVTLHSLVNVGYLFLAGFTLQPFNMEATLSSEMPVNVYQTTQKHIPPK